MTRTTNAKIAGFTFLCYIAVAYPSMALMDRATRGDGIAARLATLAQHVTDARLALVLSLAGCFAALVLAVTLWAITRDQDPDLAMLALTCRVAEGVSGAVSIPATLGLLSLVAAAGAEATGPAAAHALGGFLLAADSTVPATFFAMGSTLFSWLLLRGRLIPVSLAWLGVVASVLLVVGLSLQLGGVLHGPITQLMWLPMAAFEIPLGAWLLVKGVAAPAPC
jgi:Domain of unknown function (DUF4386)